MLPYVTNVMNNPGAALIGQFQAAYPECFRAELLNPSFNSLATFHGTVLCQNAGAQFPGGRRDIEIMLIVMTPERITNGQTAPGAIERARHRINPNQ